MKKMISIALILCSAMTCFGQQIAPELRSPPQAPPMKKKGCVCGDKCECPDGKCPAGCPVAKGLYKDYGKALEASRATGRPMVVFIEGESPVKLTGNAALTIKEKYIFTILDPKEYPQFGMSRGLVISGPGGELQAYHHAGLITGAELETQLKKFADAGQPTTTVSSSAVQFFAPPNCPNGRCPNQR